MNTSLPTDPVVAAPAAKGLRLFQATERDAKELARSIRAADAAEITAMLGEDVSVETAISVCVSMDNMPMCLRDENGDLVALLGCTGREDGSGSPWMLGTDLVKKFPRQSIAFAQHMIGLWLREYGTLENHIWGKSPNIKWLKKLGFFISRKRVFFNDTGEVFHRFSISCA